MNILLILLTILKSIMFSIVYFIIASLIICLFYLYKSRKTIWLIIKSFFVLFPNIKLFINLFKLNIFLIKKIDFKEDLSENLKPLRKKQIENYGKLLDVKRKKYERYDNYKKRIIDALKNTRSY